MAREDAKQNLHKQSASSHIIAAPECGNGQKSRIYTKI